MSVVGCNEFVDAVTDASSAVLDFYDHAEEYADWADETDAQYADLVAQEWNTVLDRWESAYEALNQVDSQVRALELQNSPETAKEMQNAIRYIAQEKHDKEIQQALYATLMMAEEDPERTTQISSLAALLHATYLCQDPVELHGLDTVYTLDHDGIMGTVVEEYTALTRMNTRYLEAIRTIAMVGPQDEADSVPEHLRDLGLQEAANQLGQIQQSDWDSWVVGETGTRH